MKLYRDLPYLRSYWNDSARIVYLIELTVCFDTLSEQARQCKKDRYHDLAEAMRAEGYTTDLITVEVGARGILNLLAS